MIRLIKPYLSFEEMQDDFAEILGSGLLTKGRFSKLLPKKVCAYTGAKHAFLATSATTALTMCLRLIGAGPGDEVIVSDFSFPASVNVIEDVGATPVFADVSRDTFNVAPETVAALITPRTKALIFVDALGNPSGAAQIAALCRDKGVVMIEDAACAIGSSVNGVKTGNIADLTCFSLHPRKLITGGEGGIITTNNDAYADVLAYKLNHGQDAAGAFVDYGYNYRMPELNCAMVVKQLEKLDAIVAERIAQQADYARRLEPLGFVAQTHDADVVHNMQSVVFRLPEGVDQQALFAFLRERDVECIFGTYCLSDCEYYRRKYRNVQPVAQYLEHHTITLPCYAGVPVAEVADCVAAYLRQR